MKQILLFIGAVFSFSVVAHAADYRDSAKCYWGQGQAGGGPINENEWIELEGKKTTYGTRTFLRLVEARDAKYSIRAQLQYIEDKDLTLLDYTISKVGKDGYEPVVVSNAIYQVAISVLADNGRVALKCE